MNITSLVERIERTPGCRVHPHSGLPEPQAGHILPDDLRTFYEVCGGAELFERAAFPISISSPQNLRLSNPVILVGVSEEELADPEYGFSRSWYIIGESHSANYISIDLGPERPGYCYDSFWDIHPFNSTIMSTSFTELLRLLLDTNGEYYRDDPAFQVLGDAYP